MTENSFPEVSCDWITTNHQDPRLRSHVGQHLQLCEACRASTEPFFSGLRLLFEHSLRDFRTVSEMFTSEVRQLSESSARKGMVDASTAFLVASCHQLLGSADNYYRTEPHDTLRSLWWLPQAFFLCRIYESERYVELKGSFIHGSAPHVGSMHVDPKVPPPVGKTFGEVTSPSSMLADNLQHGTFQYNPNLQQRIVQEIDAGKFVHALVLICDSPKHGVMSALLNVAATFHPEQIYHVGLSAGRIAMKEFWTAYQLPAS